MTWAGALAVAAVVAALAVYVVTGQRRCDPVGAEGRERKGGTDVDQEHLRLVTALMASYGAYHNHKELMAYTGAALYITGAAALMAWSHQPAASRQFTLLDVIVTVGLAVLGVVYVGWQLVQRQAAAVRAEACSNVATRWLRERPGPPQLEPTEFPRGHDTLWPRALADEFCHHGPTVARRLLAANLITLLAMLLAGAGAAWTVLRGCA